MSWWSALAICVVLTIVLAVVYVAVLWVVHTPGTHQRLSLDTGPSTQDSGQ